MLSGVFDAVREVITPAGLVLAGQVHAPYSAALMGNSEQIASLRARLAAVQGLIPVTAANPGSRVDELLEQVDLHLSDTIGGGKAQVPPDLIAEIDRELEQQGVDGVSFSRVIELLAEVDDHLTDQDNAPPSASGIIRMLGEVDEQLNLQEPVRSRPDGPTIP